MRSRRRRWWHCQGRFFHAWAEKWRDYYIYPGWNTLSKCTRCGRTRKWIGNRHVYDVSSEAPNHAYVEVFDEEES